MIKLVNEKVNPYSSKNIGKTIDILQIAKSECTPETLSLTTKLLNENPEYYTIWNKRRLIISHLIEENELAQDRGDTTEGEVAQLQSPSSILESDIEFLIPLLLKFPKCYWLWNHRLWIIQQIRSCLGTKKAESAWKNELQLVNRMLGRDNRNFHGWNYRRLVTKNLDELIEEQQILAGKSQQRKSLVEQEFEYTKKMINTNLSNFSAWHQRSKLIPVLLNERQATNATRVKLLDDEFMLIESALYTDPYDQSLWFYYQFLMVTIIAGDASNAPSFVFLGHKDRIDYLGRELDKLQDLLKGAEDCKWIYQALIEYSLAYKSLTGENIASTSLETGKWLSQLQNLDPLRRGRWNDLAKSIDPQLNNVS